MSLPRQWFVWHREDDHSVSCEFNASDARDKATIEGKKFDDFRAISR